MMDISSIELSSAMEDGRMGNNGTNHNNQTQQRQEQEQEQRQTQGGRKKYDENPFISSLLAVPSMIAPFFSNRQAAKNALIAGLVMLALLSFITPKKDAHASLATAGIADVRSSRGGGSATTVSGMDGSIQIKQQHDILLHPTEVVYADSDVEVFFQKPPLHIQSQYEQLQGLVTLFHGCDRDGIDWFQLPEERTIVEHLLSKNYAVMAFSSVERQVHRCWTTRFPASTNPDAKRVMSTLPRVLTKYFKDDFEKQNKNNNNNDDVDRPTIPLYGIGSSAGGIFLSVLADSLPFKGITLITTAGYTLAWNSMSRQSATTTSDISAGPGNIVKKPPAIAFVYMTKDDTFAGEQQIANALARIEPSNAPTLALSCEHVPLTPEYIFHRLQHRYVTYEEAANFIQTLREEPLNMFNDDGSSKKVSYYLNKDPRSVWNDIHSLAIKTQIHRSDDPIVVDSIKEILNVAWGRHETTSQHFDEVVSFWEKTR